MSVPFFQTFNSSVAHYELPKRFTFPFYYEPHPLCLLAAKELQDYLIHQEEWEHNFGLQEGQEGLVIGKMFGVLIVQKANGELGYLAAFSGKLAGTNHHRIFVPPVFDMLTEGSFFQEGEVILNQLNDTIASLEKDPAYAEALSELASISSQKKEAIAAHRESMRLAKKARKQKRTEAQHSLAKEAYERLIDTLAKESVGLKNQLHKITAHWEQQEAEAQKAVAVFQQEIQEKKSLRKVKSANLQQQLFDAYHFLNQQGEKKSLCDIFSDTILQKPPAGAGECSAPKLLQYAFLHQLTPIAMAEFWWGSSPKSEIRKHKQFYPACRGKCEPILAHMLEGIPMDTNPMLENPAIGKIIDVVYEDDTMAIIHKPAEFLSVPGKNIHDSVALRMKKKYPEATGPLIVHRLDMSTSGIMLIAKTKESHDKLQSQFIKRHIKKRYIALLEGQVKGDSGTIDLPLRVDLDNRPQQLVCYEHGKAARTHWEVIERTATHTRVYFYPVTGRTHQLRVHAAHPSGLNCPIVGDDLYGTKADRLHLHAEQIEFTHPETNKKMTIQVPVAF